jgi:hypothetical protein
MELASHTVGSTGAEK